MAALKAEPNTDWRMEKTGNGIVDAGVQQSPNHPVGNDVLRTLREADYKPITIKRQCELLGLTRSIWYYELKGEDSEDLYLIHLMDEQFLKAPFSASCG